MTHTDTVRRRGAAKKTRAPHIGPERRRPQILDAALAIAADAGISAVTMVSIAERMNVTRPVVYACFHSRAEILEALIAREELYFGKALTGILRDRRVDATESVFVEGFQSLLNAVQARPQAWRLLYGSPDADVVGLFGRGRSVVVARCTELLEPTLRSWGTEGAAAKLPILVEFWVAAGEGAVRALLAQSAETATWSPEDLGAFVGQAVYRGMRDA